MNMQERALYAHIYVLILIRSIREKRRSMPEIIPSRGPAREIR